MALGNRRPENGPREQKPNTGWLKENREKKSPKSPDYRGVANIDGRDYWVSLWEKDKGLSLAFERKDEQRRGDYERAREYQAPHRDGYNRQREEDQRGYRRDDEDPGWVPDDRR
jgi:hypothetical protein